MKHIGDEILFDQSKDLQLWDHFQNSLTQLLKPEQKLNLSHGDTESYIHPDKLLLFTHKMLVFFLYLHKNVL